MAVQQTQLARAIAKRHQVFAQQSHGYRQVFELRGQQKRVPIAAQIFPTGGARADLGDEAVVVGSRTVVVTAEGPQLARRCRFGWFCHALSPLRGDAMPDA